MYIAWMVGWHLVMLLVCAVAAALWPGSGRKKVLAFLMLAVVSVGIAWLPIRSFPIFWFVFAIPLLAILWSVRRRPWRWWRLAAGVPALVLLVCLAYVGGAFWASSATIPTEGIAHLSTFLAAKEAVRSNLNDPDSASFRGLRLTTYHGARFVCGEVNARNRMGGLVGFTEFYVPVDDPLPFPKFWEHGDEASFAAYMRTCYGDDWEHPAPPPRA